MSPRGSATGDRSVGGVPLRMLGFVVLVLAVVALLVLLASNALS